MTTYWSYGRLCVDLLYRRLTQGSRVDPTFLVLGTMRSGTSSLHSYLFQHPDYVPALMKEMGYRGRSGTPLAAFNQAFYARMPRILRRPAKRLLEGLYYSGGRAGYKKLFPKKVEMLGAQNGFQKATGDFILYGIYGHVFDPYVVPLAKQRKVIFMLRKPVDYLYSFYIHERKNSWRNDVDRVVSFDAFVRNPFAIFHQSREACVRYLTSTKAVDLFPEVDFHYDDALILPWIAYVRHIKLWLQELGPDRVMIIHSEEFYSKTQKVMDTVFAFLGMAPHTLNDLSVQNANEYEPDILPETRAHIHDWVKPYNEELYELVGRDLGWDEAE